MRQNLCLCLCDACMHVHMCVDRDTSEEGGGTERAHDMFYRDEPGGGVGPKNTNVTRDIFCQRFLTSLRFVVYEACNPLGFFGFYYVRHST